MIRMRSFIWTEPSGSYFNIHEINVYIKENLFLYTVHNMLGEVIKRNELDNIMKVVCIKESNQFTLNKEYDAFPNVVDGIGHYLIIGNDNCIYVCDPDYFPTREKVRDKKLKDLGI